MKLDNALVHLSPLVNFYKGRDFSLPLFFLCKSKGRRRKRRICESLRPRFHPDGTREFYDACICVSLRRLRETKKVRDVILSETKDPARGPGQAHLRDASLRSA